MSQQFLDPVHVPFRTFEQPPSARSCVLCVKFWEGIPASVSMGNAWQIKGNVETPEVGDYVLTRESDFGHIAGIQSMTDTTMTLCECNYITGRFTCGRELRFDSNLVRSFYRQPKAP